MTSEMLKQGKIGSLKAQYLWLPYLIATCGIVFSFFMWFVLYHDIRLYLDFFSALEEYLPWLVLLVGISFSILIAAIIRIAQLARLRAFILKETNESLTKEITERMNAEDVKQKLEVALLQGQKLQAMGTLAGGIAHDFNNLLYAVIGYVEMARDDVAKDSLVYKNLGKVLEAAQRGRELIARILAFSRRQHHQFDILNLPNTIEAALALLRPTIPASVIIDFHHAEELAVLGNQTQLHQVLVNLINNAVDAMDGEGIITITLRKIQGEDPFLKQFSDLAGKTSCEIKIQDTGHGMDQHTMERIFEPFFTTKEVGKGTGLGLSIVHTIIKEHKGEITVTSKLGQGTTFMILLPEYTPA
jgi:two-component system, cell cycle sensor histidine kinase and response regulator CckA